jgi:hypothetical protein
MNEGVKILLERMKTHPEEFVDGLGIRMSKWGSLIAQFREYLDETDINTLEEAYKPLMQQHFTERVMTELLAPEEDDVLGKWYTKPPSVLPAPSLPSITLTVDPLVNKKPLLRQTPIAGVTQTT